MEEERHSWNKARLLLAGVLATGVWVLNGCDSQTASPVSAESPQHSGQLASGGTALGSASLALTSLGATSDQGFPCTISLFDITTTNSRATLSSSGNQTLRCRAQLSTPTKAQVIVGTPCILRFPDPAGNPVITNKSQIVVSSTGSVDLKCNS